MADLPTEEGTVELPTVDELMDMVRRYGSRKFFQGFAEAEGRSGASEKHGITADYEDATAIRDYAERLSRSPVVGAVGGEPELGDTIRHIPSGEEWLVAYVRDGKLAACGWPDEVVPASDCVLVQRMPLGKKLDLLRELSRSTGHRAEHARALLRSACLTTEFGGIGVSPTGSPEGEVSNG